MKASGYWLGRAGKVRWFLPGISPPDQGPKEEKEREKKNLVVFTSDMPTRT